MLYLIKRLDWDVEENSKEGYDVTISFDLKFFADIEFDKECRRLLNDIHYFDVLRSDRSISSHGLEARTPFLDRSFVQTYLSIPPELRYHPKNAKCEKYLLRIY